MTEDALHAAGVALNIIGSDAVVWRVSWKRIGRDSKKRQSTAHHDKIQARSVASFMLEEGRFPSWRFANS